MNTFGTRTALAVLLCGFAPGAWADALELRGDAQLGFRIYDLESPFDDDDVSSFFDKSRYIRDQGSPRFGDLLHLDVGLARDDDTYLLRLERFSPWAQNERAELGLQIPGVRLDVDYRRYRSHSLRFFPTGTEATLPPFGLLAPALGARFNPDVPFSEIFEHDRRFSRRRVGVTGRLALRLDDLELENPVLRELDLLWRFETRKGAHQDTFLLDDGREPTVSQTTRFRGTRREIDQTVRGLGAGLVLGPWGRFTVVLDADFESFREDAPVVTLDRLADAQPAILPGPCPPTTPSCGERAIHFVPDTRRWSGALRVSGRVGEATLHAGAFLTRLEQSGRRAPLQERFDLDDLKTTTYSSHAAFDLPLGEHFGLNGHAKFVHRDFDPDKEAFARITAPEGQVDPILRKRTRIDAGLEASYRPRSGTLLAAGYRLHYVDRDLDFNRASTGAQAILPEFNLLEERTQSHTVYLRGRTRLKRSISLSGELGTQRAPRVGLPRELESSIYAEGRGSVGWHKPLPATLSFFGRFRNGRSDGVRLLGDSPEHSKRKGFERKQWGYGVTLAAVPTGALSLFASFAQNRDEQEFDHLRTNFPRFVGIPLLRFYLDSEPRMVSDVRTLVAGARHRLGESLEVSISSSFTWARVDFEGSGATPTAAALQAVNSIQNRILGLEARLEYELLRGVRLGMGYRFDDFRDERDLEPLGLDTEVQTLSLDVTVDLGSLPW